MASKQLYRISEKVNFWRVLKQIYNGKTTMRAIECEMLRSLKISGDVIDLASNHPFSPEYEVIDYSEANITFSDLEPKSKDVIKLDLEKELPIKDSSYDHVFLFNALPIIYNGKQLIKEINRISRKGVVIISYFVRQYCPHPNDYYRYTGDCLERMLRESGFKKIKIVPVRRGPVVLAFSTIETYISSKILRTVLFPVPWFIDGLILLHPKKEDILKRSELAHICIAEN